MLEKLKIKIKSLAAESTFIRHEERKLKGIMHFEAQRQSFRHEKDKPRPEPRKYPAPKENSQEIYDEATIKFFNLQRHRVNAVRLEARLSHLAYAFLRGQPYSLVEQSTHDVIDTFEDQFQKTDTEFKERRIFDKVKAMAKRFSADAGIKDQIFQQKWAEWIDDAKAHLKSQVKEEAAPVASA